MAAMPYWVLHSCRELWIRDLIVELANSELLASIRLHELCLNEILDVLEQIHVFCEIGKTYIL